MYIDKKQHILRDSKITCSDGHILPIDVYIPSGLEPNSEALLFVHGGGFIGGDKDQFSGIAAYLALSLGVVCITLQYRTGPNNPYPAAVLDCIEAADWIAKNSKKLSIDKDKICLIAGSPGANMALLAMNHDWRAKNTNKKYQSMFYIKNFIVLNGIFSLNNLWEKNNDLHSALTLYFNGKPSKEKLNESSPIEYEYAGFDILLLHGDVDNVVPIEECNDFIKHLGKTNTIKLIAFKNEKHAWFNDIYKQKTVLLEIEKYIEELRRRRSCH